MDGGASLESERPLDDPRPVSFSDGLALTGVQAPGLFLSWIFPPRSRRPAVTIEPNAIDRYYWRDLWRYRELFWILAWRDIAIRYRQTVFGVAWALIQPLMTMSVFTVLFGKLAGMPSEGGAPYIIMVAAGTLPWQFFATALGNCSNSCVGNAGLLSKVYFPRLAVPASSVVVAFVDFLISFAILVALMAWHGYAPTWRFLALPFLLAVAFATAMGAGLWFAALNVRYRDVRYVVPFVIQMGLYISPVGYSSSAVPEEWRLLYSLNPVAGIIDGFRWAIIGEGSSIDWMGFAAGIGLAGLLLLSGIRYFRQAERGFADVI
jgi:lipopolysaccharide transport system permease protein